MRREVVGEGALRGRSPRTREGRIGPTAQNCSSQWSVVSGQRRRLAAVRGVGKFTPFLGCTRLNSVICLGLLAVLYCARPPSNSFELRLLTAAPARKPLIAPIRYSMYVSRAESVLKLFCCATG